MQIAVPAGELVVPAIEWRGESITARDVQLVFRQDIAQMTGVRAKAIGRATGTRQLDPAHYPEIIAAYEAFAELVARAIGFEENLLEEPGQLVADLSALPTDPPAHDYGPRAEPCPICHQAPHAPDCVRVKGGLRGRPARKRGVDG